MALASGTEVGPYRIVRPLGAGGRGEVYCARDERLTRDVALKVLPADVASDPERLRRFAQEARAAGQLAHPNILVVHDVGTHAGQPYLVTELLEGATLRAVLRGGAVPVPTAIEWGTQVAHGLAAAHERGIVHRDLKPENIFLTRDGVVKLLDFGLAKVEAPRGAGADSAASAITIGAEVVTSPGMVLGTMGYMAPEQVDLRNRLGLYELFTRLPQHSATTFERLSSENVSEDWFWTIWYFLAHAYHRLGSYDRELAVAERGQQRFPDVLELRARKGGALAALGRLTEVDRLAEAAMTTPARSGSLARFLIMIAAELRAHGHTNAAQRVADRAVAWIAGRPPAERTEQGAAHVLALALAGRWREAASVAEALPKSLSSAQWDIETIFWGQPAVYRLGWIGCATAHLGDTANARRVSGELRDFKSSCPPFDRTYWRAAIAAQLGAKDEAMRLFEEAVAQEALMVWQADHDVLLEPLWNEPRFRALVRPWERQ